MSKIIFRRRNLDASQHLCSRDHAPPLVSPARPPAQLRLMSAHAQSKTRLIRIVQLLTKGPKGAPYLGVPKSVTTVHSQPLPGRTHPQTVVPVCLSAYKNDLPTPQHTPYLGIAGKFRIQSASNCSNSIARDIYYPSTRPCDRGRANPRLQSPRFLSCESR